MKLLEKLIEIPAPSGAEQKAQAFIKNYVASESGKWKCKPEIIDTGIQECLVLVFGKPRTAVFAHIDSIGFTVGYENELINIGSPDASKPWKLVGYDSQGSIEGSIAIVNNKTKLDFNRTVDRGTQLTFKPNFKEDDEYIVSPYLDNRLGCYTALKLAENLTDGIICFSTYEEHRGGSAQFLSRMIFEQYQVQQALILDITWCTKGVHPGKGVAISMRDSGIPRKLFLDRIINLAEKSGVPYQLEVESAGGSDGSAIQSSPYPIDWCFVGAPESGVHSPEEKVHKKDIESMIDLYKYLLVHL